MDQAPDPVLASLDLAQAGAILANMIEALLMSMNYGFLKVLCG